MTAPLTSPPEDAPPAPLIIVGGGIVGLTFALALRRHVAADLPIEIYDKSPDFTADVGAGMGMYANGLRVMRDIDPQLLEAVKANGCAFEWRRFNRHDGTEIMAANEAVLHQGDEEIESIGIRRWRLLNVLYEQVQQQGIPVYFNKRCSKIVLAEKKKKDNKSIQFAQVLFDDGTSRQARLVFAADGSKSKIRERVTKKTTKHKLTYTGITCLMGLTEQVSMPEEYKGISCPSAPMTKCHAVYFPVSHDELCFQMHFRVPHQESDKNNWGTLDEKVGQEECHKVAQMLTDHSWDERYITPLENVHRAVRIGFCELQPQLTRWVFNEHDLNKNKDATAASTENGYKALGCRIILLGDAAHPPVPYSGQGAQMGLEDAGTLALLLKYFLIGNENLGAASTNCATTNSGTGASLAADMLDEDDFTFLETFDKAMAVYEQVRIPRVHHVHDCSMALGNMQAMRADSEKRDEIVAKKMQRHMFFHETLPQMLPGAQYDYKKELETVLNGLKQQQQKDEEITKTCTPTTPIVPLVQE